MTVLPSCGETMAITKPMPRKAEARNGVETVSYSISINKEVLDEQNVSGNKLEGIELRYFGIPLGQVFFDNISHSHSKLIFHVMREAGHLFSI